MVNFAPSGFAPGLATGGIRCTLLSSAGILHTGSERVPENFEPKSVVSNFSFWNRLLSLVLKGGLPHSAQQRMRMAHGSHAPAV